jgi:hypothetical protein
MKKELGSSVASVASMASGLSAPAVKLLKAAPTVLAVVRAVDRQRLLRLLGLARRVSPLVSVAIFGGGLAIGLGIGLLVAPGSRAGALLRDRIARRSAAPIDVRDTSTPDVAERHSDPAPAVPSPLDGASPSVSV